MASRLGIEEARGAKAFYGFDPDADFAVPDGVREHFSAHFGQRGADAHAAWRSRFAAYRAQYPDLADADRPHAAARAARRLGHRFAGVRRPMPRAWPRATPRARC